MAEGCGGSTRRAAPGDVRARAWTTAGLALLLLTPACTPPPAGEDAGAGADTASPARGGVAADTPSAVGDPTDANAAQASAIPVHPWLGTWRVVSHRMGGVSALSDAEAQRFQGRMLVLTADSAVSADERCDAPTYDANAVTADRALADHRTTAQALGVGAGAEAWTSVAVRCRGAAWTTLGGTLLLTDSDRALAPWDGVFFELERVDPPPLLFQASGFEPGWRVEIRRGRWIHAIWDYGEQEAWTPVPVPEVDAQTGRITYRAQTERTTLELRIDPTSCTAGGSGLPLPTTVTLRVAGQDLQGCGSAAPVP